LLLVLVKKRRSEEVVTANDSLMDGTLSISSQHMILMVFFHATNGRSWRIRKAKWKDNMPFRDWRGVIVNASGGVLELNLSSFKISGCEYLLYYDCSTNFDYLLSSI